MSSTEDEEPSTTIWEVFRASWEVVAKAGETARTAVTFVIHWVERRSRLTQILIAVGLGQLVTELPNVEHAIESVSTVLRIGELQVLLAIFGILVVQTVMQRERFNQVADELRHMGNSPSVRSDGGRETPPRDEKGRVTSDRDGTSGGGALGGAIAGAAIGSSAGPQGAIAGAVLGAILGDELEKSSD